MSSFLRYRLPSAVLLTSGALLACETAAQIIGARPPHETIFGPLYNPLDGLHWLRDLNGRCIVGPWLVDRMNPLHMNGGMTARPCVTQPGVIDALDARFGEIIGATALPAVGLRIAENIAKRNEGKPQGRVLPPVRALSGEQDPLVIEYGTATGKLTKLGHESGIKRGQRVRVVGDDVSQDTLILGGKGSGKAQPVDTPVFTPDGLRRLGDLRVGDFVIGRNGEPTKVVGVFPQGMKPGYRVTFSDGASTLCCDEHLWEVSTGKSRFATPEYNQRRAEIRRLQGKSKNTYKPRPKRCKQSSVRSLAEIRAHMAQNYRPETNGRLSIPLVDPIQFSARELPLDPYLLGCLIGDGGLHGCSTMFTSADQFVLDEVAEALRPTGTELVSARSGGYDYRITRVERGCRFTDDERKARSVISTRAWQIGQVEGPEAAARHRELLGPKRQANPVLPAIRSLGLNVLSHEKFIPDDYKLSTVNDRVALLQGLCDTDGSAARSCVDYTTTSKRLADDLVFLVQSLGGVAKVVSRVTTFTHKGERRSGRTSYRLSIRLDNNVMPFRLPRKVEAYKTRVKDPVLRHIAKIEAAGDREMVCIAVDAPDHLYVVEGAIVTHNTTSALNPILLQAMLQGCGALIFNVKGDYDRTVLRLAKKAGRRVRVIGVGPGAEPMDLLANVSPEMAAGYISALLLLTGNKASEAVFWNVNAANLSRAVLGLLWYFPRRYSLPGLYRYLFVKEYRMSVDKSIEELLKQIDDVLNSGALSGEKLEAVKQDLRYIAGCQQEIANFYTQTHNIQSGVSSQLSQILAKTVIAELEDAFGTPREESAQGFSFEHLYERGDIVVINAPLQKYDLAAAAIMTFAKLRFYTTMEQRRLWLDANQTRRVGLFIDECQQIAACSQTGMSDHSFLAMSRDTGTFCVFATQSVSALYAKIGHDMAAALKANLRQLIILRTEDRATIDDALHLLGQIEYDRMSTSATYNPGAWRPSKGTTHAPQLQAVANPALIRNLKTRQALAILSIDGESADDVIQLKPEYGYPDLRKWWKQAA